jgi:putative PIN family toxin of toxin-antitoxin system
VTPGGAECGFNHSKPRQALDKAQDIGIILLSIAVFKELQEVLSRPKFDRYITLERRKELLENLVETTEFININETINECRDPKDNKYLELAVSGKAECIVTGDEDLLILNPFRQIDILTVQKFLDDLIGIEKNES